MAISPPGTLDAALPLWYQTTALHPSRSEDSMRPADPIRSVLKYKSTTLYSLPPEASVYDAIELMSQKSIGAILVMTSGRLVGFLSERDYARKVILKGKSSRETQIREIMSVPVITVSPGDTVDEC